MRTEMSRRTFGTVIGGAMTGRAAAAVEAGQAGEIAALYKRAIVIDALANPGSMNVSWPPRGPLSEKQRDAIAASGITAINVTVSGDTFEASTRTIALWTGEADRYPTLALDRPAPRRHRARRRRTARSASSSASRTPR